MIYYVFERFSAVHLNKDVNLIIKSAAKFNYSITRVSQNPMPETGQTWISPSQFSKSMRQGIIGSGDTVFLYHLGQETFKFLDLIYVNNKKTELPRIYIKCDFSGYLPIFGCPPVLNSHNFWLRWQASKFKNSFFYFRLFKLIEKTRAKLIFESEEQRDVFLSYAPKELQTLVVPNPIFTSTKHSIIKDIDFVSVGNWRHRHQKNPDLLRELLKKISSSHKCVVIGAGASELFGDLNLAVFDELDHGEVVGWIARSKYLLSTSRYEGFPNVFLEAISVQTKILSTDYPAARAVHRQGVAWLLSFDPTNFNLDGLEEFGQRIVDFDQMANLYPENYWKQL